MFATLAFATGSMLVASTPPAWSQDSRPWFLRGLLSPFFPQRQRYPEAYPPPGYEAPAQPPRTVRPKRTVRERPSKPQPQSGPSANSGRSAVKRIVEPEVAIQPKAPDAKVVLVVGDFLATSLAEGLDAVFAENPKVKIVDRSKGSSGFVRLDRFDWPDKISEIIQEEKPQAVVVLIGANDRQQMRIAEARETLRNEAWLREYTARAANFASAVYATKAPLVWVGATPFRSPKASADMLAFNEIFRKVSADVDAEFVDVWEGFVDENGAFVTHGPDVAGQQVRLRTGDGVNLTRAGERKLAFYTEKALKRLLGEAGRLSPANPGMNMPSAGSPGAQMPLDRTVPVSLSDPELDGGSDLLGAVASAPQKPNSDGKAIPGVAPASVAGRADNFSWPSEPNSGPLRSTIPSTSPSAETAAPAAAPAAH